MSPYLVEALAPGGGWSGGGGGGSPLVVAAIGVGVAGNPSPSALATHSTGGGGGSEVAVAWNGGFGNWKMGVSDWGFYTVESGARLRRKFSRPFEWERRSRTAPGATAMQPVPLPGG